MVAIAIGVFLSLAFGVVIGSFLGSLSVDHKLKREIRKRLELEWYGAIPITRLADTRREPRIPMLEKVTVEVRAPVLDSAGIPLVGEEIKFSARMVDVSKHGVGMFAQHFLQPGMDVEVACSDKAMNFPSKKAEVRYSVSKNKGLRIGLELFEPIESVGAKAGV